LGEVYQFEGTFYLKRGRVSDSRMGNVHPRYDAAPSQELLGHSAEP
jgi:hypothetical protein